MSKTTQEEFCNIINERYNNQFEVVSEYVSKGHVDVKCNICNSIINVNCDQAKYDYIVCRNCKAQNQIDEHNGVGEYKLISNYKGTQFPISVRHKCGTKIDFKRATTATYNKIKCPLCDKYSKSLTHEGFLIKLYNKYGDEYEVLSHYESMTKDITVRHNVCGEVFDIAPDSLLNSSCGCRKCINNSMRTPHDEFVNNVHNILPDIQIISEYKGRNYAVTCKCLKCGDEFNKKACSLLNGHGCKNCTPQGKSGNNLWKTHPHIAKYLKNSEDGYNHQYSTNERL
jgi:predicted  nucleic acid-binding Zn-ribbon protein